MEQLNTYSFMCCKKIEMVTERTYYILYTLSTNIPNKHLLIILDPLPYVNACEQSCTMMIIQEGSMPKTKQYLKAILYWLTYHCGLSPYSTRPIALLKAYLCIESIRLQWDKFAFMNTWSTQEKAKYPPAPLELLCAIQLGKQITC